MLENEPCAIVENEFVKPGKGQAFVRVKYRNLKTGRINERTFKSNETVQAADVMERELQYLYSDGDSWYFMDPESYEQYVADPVTMGDAAKWIKEQELCIVVLWNGTPISVTPPHFTVLKVTETEPGVRGDTASGATKPATLETGAVVKVPLFIDQDELIKIDTRIGEYVARAKA